jgi:hypothetical protein
MTAQSYCRLAALIFALVALLQLSRAVGLWPPVTVGGAEMPLWPSWVAFVVAGTLAWLGASASRT